MNEKYVVHPDPEIKQFVFGYLEHRRQDLVKLKQLLIAEDYVAIKDVGHRMHGGGKLYGCDIVSVFGRQIEISGQKKDVVQMKEALDMLETLIQIKRKELERSNKRATEPGAAT